MTANVVDACVAAKWFLPASTEPLVYEARVLLKGYVTGQIQFIVPDLFWAEFGNIMWKAVRQGRYTKGEADVAIESLAQRNLQTISSIVLFEPAFKIATAFDRTMYDSLYIATAVQCNCELITADERLANAVAAHFPVKWLGAI